MDSMDAMGKITIEEALERIELFKKAIRNRPVTNCSNSTVKIGGKEHTLRYKYNKIAEDDNMSNVVQVRFLQDPSKKRYTFNVPCNEKICKGDVVRIRNKNDSEMIAIAETDSEMLSENAIDMIMDGKEVISWVIGKYEYNGFEELKNI